MFSPKVPTASLKASFFWNELHLIQVDISAGIKFRLSELKVKNTGFNTTGGRSSRQYCTKYILDCAQGSPSTGQKAGCEPPRWHSRCSPESNRGFAVVSEQDARPRKGGSYQWQPSRLGYWHGLFYHGSHGQ